MHRKSSCYGGCSTTPCRQRVAASLRHVSRHIVCRTAALLDDVSTDSMDAASVSAADQIPQGEEAEHPALPYTPAFRVGDIVYGTNMFANHKGARVHVMYHEGLYG